MKSQELKTFYVLLPEDLLAAFDRVAEEKGISRTLLIEKLIKKEVIGVTAGHIHDPRKPGI